MTVTKASRIVGIPPNNARFMYKIYKTEGRILRIDMKEQALKQEEKIQKVVLL